MTHAVELAFAIDATLVMNPFPYGAVRVDEPRPRLLTALSAALRRPWGVGQLI